MTRDANARRSGRLERDRTPNRKPTSRASLARIKAYECLSTVRIRNAFASDVIDKVIDRSRLDASDRAFATRIVLGVVSMRGSLDFVLDRCMRTPDDVKPDVRDALRISAYEILYLDKSAHAAVDQGVELVRYVQPKATGVANAVLRKVIKAKESFPFGDPATDICAYSLLHGFPAWLAEMLVDTLGPKDAHSFIVASNEPAPVFLALNPLKGDIRDAEQAIRQLGTDVHRVSVEGMDVEECIRIDNAKVLADERFERLISDGKVLVSDAAAQAISKIACQAAFKARQSTHDIDDSSDDGSLSCLEVCAGRGTKTILLQRGALMTTGSQFKPYIAVDNIAFKTKILAERAVTYGADVTESLCADASLIDSVDFETGDATFDLVFLDSPCSGLGTLRRHPEIRWRITPDVIEQDAKRDDALIASAAARVKPGGILAYSTCTVTFKENASVVKRFLSSSVGHEFALVPISGKPAFATHLAPGSCDAHFCAIMQRKRVI